MGNNPSKPENSSKGTSSPTSASHVPTSGNPSQRKGHSRRETASSTNQSPSSPTTLPSQALSPPRKPSLKPQQYLPSSTDRNTRRQVSMGNSLSQEKQEGRRKDDEGETHSGPIQVPSLAQQARRKTPDIDLDPSGPPIDSNYVPASNLNYPPRLPLPIQEEIYTPGSPIITPDDLSTALREEAEGTLPSHTSLLSHTTLDDDEDVDLLDHGAKGRAVPTTIQWTHGGSKVYVTGTFANWSKKYRMHRK